MTTGLAGGMHRACKALLPATLTRSERTPFAPLPPEPLTWQSPLLCVSFALFILTFAVVSIFLFLEQGLTILLIAVSFLEPPLEVGVFCLETKNSGARNAGIKPG